MMTPHHQAVMREVMQAFRISNTANAISILNKNLQNDLSIIDYVYELGVYFAKIGMLDEALIIFNAVEPYKKNDVKVPYNVGLIHSLRGEHSLALLAYDRALKIKHDDVDTLVNLSSIHSELKNYHHALTLLKLATKISPESRIAWLNLAAVFNNLNLHHESLDAYNRVLSFNPADHESYVKKSVPLSRLKYFTEALDSYDKALALKPEFAEGWSNKGNLLQELKQYNEAITHYDKALALNPEFAEAWSNKGNALQALKQYNEAITHYDKALALNPEFAEAWSNKGNALQELKQYYEAITHFDKALALHPEFAEAWSNKGNALQALKQYNEAITHYDKALALKTNYAEGWFNKANALQVLKGYEKAIAHYDKALALNPEFAEYWSNKGNALHELKRFDEAIACHDKSISLKPDYAEAWSNKGNTLLELKRYDEAIAHYDKALSLKPDIDWISGILLHAKMKICSWTGLAEALESIFKKVIANEKAINPFQLLALDDDALLHKKASEIYAQDRYPFNSTLGSIPKSAKKEKIRIAYFSPDFRNHPVSFLTAELYELHDRSRFEVFAFSLQKTLIGDETNLRLRKGFDRFIDVDNMSDLDITQLARKLEIDIAIDLAGPTQFARTEIFSYKAAPIQVNWLGYPGTIGTSCIDYIIADKTLIPESHQRFYTEKVVYLPDTYMVDDSKRIASSKRFTRESLGLPDGAIVFCCFNNDYKFNPQVLDSWSRILLNAKNSVIWISENNQNFRVNIVAEFKHRGIDPDRIIFAQRVEKMADHLSRYALADLFLDTHPYNAHTTAIDSLKAGVPIMTLMGKSFASRVASSLLNAIDLPELITTTQEEYVATAIELANNPQKLLAIKQKLANNRLSTPLFDTPLFTKNIETAYIKMHERYLAGLEPDHILIQ